MSDTPPITTLPPGQARGTYATSATALTHTPCASQHPGITPGDRQIRGERALWRSVLIQMLQDATNPGLGRYTTHNREQARAWLRMSNPDFRIVCEYADLCPYAIMERVARVLQQRPGAELGF